MLEHAQRRVKERNRRDVSHVERGPTLSPPRPRRPEVGGAGALWKKTVRNPRRVEDGGGATNRETCRSTRRTCVDISNELDSKTSSARRSARRGVGRGPISHKKLRR